MCLLRINLPNLCPNINHFDAVDFSECHSEEVISFFWRSVYNSNDCRMKMARVGSMTKRRRENRKWQWHFLSCSIWCSMDHESIHYLQVYSVNFTDTICLLADQATGHVQTSKTLHCFRSSSLFVAWPEMSCYMPIQFSFVIVHAFMSLVTQSRWHLLWNLHNCSYICEQKQEIQI